MRNHSIGVILLAAGESARLGEPKQLLQFRGETLLRRTAKIALSVSRNSVVVLGARFEILMKEIEDLHIQIVENKSWQVGMSSSIKIGLSELIEQDSKLNGVLLMVCDQPFVEEKLLAQMIDKFVETDCLIVACEYQNTLGVPALFHLKLFPELFSLNTPKGAGQLIKKYHAQVERIPFSAGEFDIDTTEDYKNLMENFNG